MTALDDRGRPSFNLLQNSRSSASRLVYFAFDVLSYKGPDVTHLPLSERRTLLLDVITRSNYIGIAEWTTELEDLTQFVTELQLEGIAAKQIDSRYESGKRSGAWVKLRFNKRQEFVIGG